jgi:dTDP-4-dehydrorhamnose 3,5-epimerase/CDP-3, 6-dideoxy-D-glycero-D-glycero-4-hexulose-5-epimerase
MGGPAAAFGFEPTPLRGLLVARPRVFQDARGVFVKTFQREAFEEHGISFAATEEFYSISSRHVLRGMHFQTPPAAHAKLVYCLGGRVLDVVLDLRRGSDSYGRVFSITLNGNKGEGLFIPKGLAHGFLSLEDNSLMYYATDHSHSPQHDDGVAWNSFGFDWPVLEPLLSQRDQKFQGFHEFSSPF